VQYSESEIDLAAKRKSVRLGTDHVLVEYNTIADRARFCPGMDVVKDAFAVGVNVPIEAHSKILEFTTLDLSIG
jgi:hypothetical protein